MSKENFEKAIKFVFFIEGGYSDKKNDRDGKTNYGVTQTTYDEYRKSKNLKLQPVKNISKNEAKQLYYEEFWLKSGADEITNPDLAVTIFDTAVLHGVGTAKMYLKHSNGDIDTILDFRRELCDNLVKKYPSQIEFIKGWNNRFNKLKKSIEDGEFTNLSQEQINEIEQALINQIMTTFDGIYSRREITKLVHDTLSKTPAESLMNKSKEITQTENSKPQKKRNYSNTSSSDGKWVTINGNHVLIEK